MRELFARVRKSFSIADRRIALTKRYLRGSGIELGALHCPLWTPPGVSVLYVDRMDVGGLRGQYPELKDLPLVAVDVVDDGEKLVMFEDCSQDFIIANHFIEHTEDPIGAIKRYLEVLKPGGVLYMAVPDKHLTFDKLRPETDFNHLLRDHIEGPQWSHDGHMREFSSLAINTPPEQLEAVVARLKACNYSIHFHVWSESSFRDFIQRLIVELQMPMKVEAFADNRESRAEIICILRKSGKAL